MAWTITDTDDLFITLDDGFRSIPIHKQSLYFDRIVTEPYLNIYWHYYPANPVRYHLKLDYSEVTAYGGANPTSAQDLKDILIAYITSGWGGGHEPLQDKGDLLTNDGISESVLPVGTSGQVLTVNPSAPDGIEWADPSSGGGPRVDNFIDLLTTTNLESQWVEAFDTNTGQGGGYFKYYDEPNASIPLIAGYQIRTSLQANGYWRRIDSFNLFNPVWCGAQNDSTPATLQAQGWSQAEADTMWGSGLVDVTTDTYDLAALRYCFALLETYPYITVHLEPKNFYVNDTIWLPQEFEYLRVYGNFAWIWASNANTFDIIGRPQPADLAEAEVMLNCKIYVECLNISAQGSQTCFKPGPSTSCTLVSVNTYNGEQGIHLQFCLNNYLIECENKLSVNGILVENDDCSDCDGDNSNSNMTTLVHCRCYNEDGAGEKAFAFFGVSGGAMEHCTVEGHFYANPIYIDGQNAGTIKGFNIWNCHYECVDTSTDSTNEAFIYVRLAGGVVRIVGVIGHYPMIMVNSGGTTGNLHVSIEDVVGWAPYTGNKWFYNGGSSSHDYINIPDLGGDPSIISGLILGTPMFDWSTAGPGNNRFRLLASPYVAELPSYGTGDVVGPGSATDNHIVLFDGATGKLIKSAGEGLSAYFKKSVDDTDDITVGATNLFNQTHTGEVTGATALAVDKTAISNKTLVTPATGDHILIGDASDSDNLKKVLISALLALSVKVTNHYIHATNDGMADGATQYIGARYGSSSALIEANINKEVFTVTGTITAIYYTWRNATVATTENATITIRIFNAAGVLQTETTLTTTQQFNATVGRSDFTGLSIAVTQGWQASIKFVNPTYATNPSAMDHHFVMRTEH